MSQEYIILPLTVEATAVVLADRCVDQDGGYATAAAACFGVTTEDVNAIGDLTTVAVMGTKIMTASAAIAKDAYVEVVGAEGKIVTKTSGVTIGRTLQAASADGDKIEVLLFNV